MSHIHVAVSALVAAPPTTVYTILADYNNHHPHILPKPYFSGIEVEQGGYGEGTLLRVHMQALGRKYVYHMRVTEPEPGRILAETDINTGLVTTFTVEPGENQGAKVTIATTWEPERGIKGLLDRIGTPPMMRRIYAQELEYLKQYAQRVRV
ncbi:MAG: hypothetical protein KatS3mg057_1928 [Herpetosiphonaceae bacterium]|nr:MAG: hypothetical protein KatS3mg057_1928 [Herpetosiphonaceae bacterium]